MSADLVVRVVIFIVVEGRGFLGKNEIHRATPPGAGDHCRARQARRGHRLGEDQAMTDAEPSDKSPEQLRVELDAMRSELGDTVEELAHRVDVPARVRAQKDDTIIRLQANKDQAAHLVQDSVEKGRAVLADKVGQARTAYSKKAPPAVQQRVDRARAVIAEKAPVVQQRVSKVVSDATPVVE